MLIQHLHFLLALDSSCSRSITPGGPGLYDNLCANGAVSITALQDTLILVTNIIRILLWLSGALGVIFIIVGGIFYITSAGNPTQIKKAREILTNVVTGLVIILAAYAIVTFISDGLG
ncbi:hypothetical protein HJC99_01280 [Candidatus Saccharibacteria bacterium]|nr:hypothetical protein [Candidatus Saccharibacteria bacterium]